MSYILNGFSNVKRHFCKATIHHIDQSSLCNTLCVVSVSQASGGQIEVETGGDN